MKKVIVYLLFVMFMFGCSSKSVILEPTQDAIQSTVEEKELIQGAISLHDQGKYDLAIQKYNEVLKQNPANSWALYELSYTYFSIKQYEKCLDVGIKALKYKSNFLPQVYNLVGSSYDNLGKIKDAIKIFKKGLEFDPINYLLHYNLGLVYYRQTENELARQCFKNALKYNHRHSSSHIALAKIYYSDNYRIPAIMAYSRFLILESTTQRSAEALQALQELMGQGVQAQDKKNIQITLASDAKTYDGDFGSVDLGLSMSRALRFVEENKNKSDIATLFFELESMYQIMLEISENDEYKGFAWEYYSPYFIEMKKNELFETYFYYIFQLADNPKIQNWLQNNNQQIDKFLAWSKQYKFNNSAN